MRKAVFSILNTFRPNQGSLVKTCRLDATGNRLVVDLVTRALVDPYLPRFEVKPGECEEASVAWRYGEEHPQLRVKLFKERQAELEQFRRQNLGKRVRFVVNGTVFQPVQVKPETGDLTARLRTTSEATRMAMALMERDQ